MLEHRKKYLQIALNSTPAEGIKIISSLPPSDRIIIEAGTPLIKAYGIEGIRTLHRYFQFYSRSTNAYVVADTKCMDRASTEVRIAKSGGAQAATVLGAAPIATINYFINACEEQGLNSMIDMIGVNQPIQILRKLKKQPTVVILHRGVDEESFDRHCPIPYLQITKIRSSFDTLISIAGGDTLREVQRAIFNDADIAVVWKNFYSLSHNTGQLAKEFLAQIK